MNKYIMKYASVLFFIMSLGLVSCDDRDDEITELDLDRVLTPYNINYGLSNVVDLTLTWKDIQGAEGYIVEVYADSMEFKEENFVAMDEVLTNKFEYTLQGDMQYSARVKAVSTTTGDSNWNGIAFATGFKSIFLGFETGDITETTVKFRWPAGVKATHIILRGGPTEVRKDINEAEIAAGIVEIIDLTPNIKYTATLYNDQQRLGMADILTIPAGAIVVNPTDDLKAKIAEAEDGAIFILNVGEYLKDGEVLPITKSISIRGTDETNRPTIHAQFGLDAGSLELSNLVLDGLGELDHVVRLASTEGTYPSISFTGCDVKNYKKSILAGEISAKVEVQEFVIYNSEFTDIMAVSAEAIDIRAGYVAKIDISNSTFNNVAPSRSLIRLDEKSSDFPGRTSVVTVKNNTFNNVSNSDSHQGFFYVRFKTNSIIFESNLVTNTNGFLNKGSSTTQPACAKNNYFNAPNFLTGSTISGVKTDNGAYTTEDPQYENAEEGDFTVNNGMVQVGDPRWK